MVGNSRPARRGMKDFSVGNVPTDTGLLKPLLTVISVQKTMAGSTSQYCF